jgi:transposase-like protein
MNAYFKANEMFAMTSGSEPFEPRRMSLLKAVVGPLGEPMTLESLPPANCKRWVPRRKAEVVAAVSGGLLTVVEACTRYGLTPEEFAGWKRLVERTGLHGLRVTRAQFYKKVCEEFPEKAGI